MFIPLILNSFTVYCIRLNHLQDAEDLDRDLKCHQAYMEPEPVEKSSVMVYDDMPKNR